MELTYAQAINKTLTSLMESDERVLLIGQGVTSPWYVGATTTGLYHRFASRVIDTPVSENGMTGVAVGAALTGMRPIIMHPRQDFIFPALDQIVNHAANWRYMFGGQLSVPLVVWAIVNRGGEQGAQHSQSLQAMFAHVPGLKVVMPSTPYDARGLLNAAVADGNPVIFCDDRWLYSLKGEVPDDYYTVPVGKGIVRRHGTDVTLVATSCMAVEGLQTATELEKEGISVEVIDPRTIKPLDEELILDSVRRTGRLVVADGGWKTCGFGAEVAALVAERLGSPVARVALPDYPAPASRALEQVYYPKAKDIALTIKRMIER